MGLFISCQGINTLGLALHKWHGSLRGVLRCRSLLVSLLLLLRYDHEMQYSLVQGQWSPVNTWELLLYPTIGEDLRRGEKRI